LLTLVLAHPEAVKADGAAGADEYIIEEVPETKTLYDDSKAADSTESSGESAADNQTEPPSASEGERKDEEKTAVASDTPTPSLAEIFAGTQSRIEVSRSGETVTWKLGFVKSEEVAETIKSVFEQAIADGRLRIIENRSRNTIIARFKESKDFSIRQEWADLMNSMDRPENQVLLEIMIVELVINDITQWGANLRTIAEAAVGDNKFAQLINMSHTTNSMDVEAEAVEGFKYYVTSGNKLRALLFSGKTKNKVRVLSSPQIIASNHKQAIFKLGRTLPIITGSTIANGVTTYAYENKDIGINISLTPRIGNTQEIGLDIDQQVNDLLSYDPDKKVADFAHKTLTSTVTLLNGQTVALGGYIQSSDRVNRKGIPGLSDLPMIGRYFNRDLKTVEKVEVIVFITPKLLANPQEILADTYRKTDRYKTKSVFTEDMELQFAKGTKFYNGEITRRAERRAVKRWEKEMASEAMHLELNLDPGKELSIGTSPQEVTLPQPAEGIANEPPQAKSPTRLQRLARKVREKLDAAKENICNLTK
jgi:type II secretory pathway component GspD/PulD (secretin)